MGVDVLQMAKTKDLVSDSDAKYAVVATVLVPFFEAEHVEPLPVETPENVEPGDWGEGLDEKQFPIFSEETPRELDELLDPGKKNPPGIGSGKSFGGYWKGCCGSSCEGLWTQKNPKQNENEGESGVESEILKRDESPQKELEELVDKCKKSLQLKHLTLVEPVGSRQTSEILSRLVTYPGEI